MPTIIQSASVKIMLSYDYNHFETSIMLYNENGVNLLEIDQARKQCNKLCDKAILQYKRAKKILNQRLLDPNETTQLKAEVEQIADIPEDLRTPEEKAKVKAWEDAKYEGYYGYDDEMFDYPF